MSDRRYSRESRIALIVMFGCLTICTHAADKYSILRTFNSSTGGIFPSGNLIMDHAGNLYGATSEGGSGGSGTIFELARNASGNWDYTVLYNCTLSDCDLPTGALAMDSQGNLYGSSYFGNVFEITQSESGWTATVVHSFTGGPERVSSKTYPRF